MGTLLADSEPKSELDDSGCIQDGSPPAKKPATENGYHGQAQLLDLSDDVLLYILKHCSPRDLKALGYTCSRLGALICDHTLWQVVDAREQPCGPARLRWLFAHALHNGTTHLQLSGYAREASGCLGHVNRTRDEVEHEMADSHRRFHDDGNFITQRAEEERLAQRARMLGESRHHRMRIRFHPPHALPRLSGSPSWPENADEIADGSKSEQDLSESGKQSRCVGPKFTLTQCMLRQLRAQCPRLTSLSLEYCNINCKTTGINQFPPTLKSLSLRGAKCYNLPLDKSFLFKIHDYLPCLEFLDVSECEWMEPASLLPLSKITTLRRLVMRDCQRMAEFVAYASLATRYGFRKLKSLDLRGSPVGDSEVSALGWVPELEELFLAPAPAPDTPYPLEHAHYKGDAFAPHRELEPWELQEPEYYKIKQSTEIDPEPAESAEFIDEQIEHLRHIENNMCLHGTEYNLCTDGIRTGDVREEPVNLKLDGQTTKRKQEDGSGDCPDLSQDPGPSQKRKKPADGTIESIVGSTMLSSSDLDSSDDEDVKKTYGNVNDGASTSKNVSEQETSQESTASTNANATKSSDSESSTKSHSTSSEDARESTSQSSQNPKKKQKFEQFVQFRQNREPVLVQYPVQNEPERIEPRLPEPSLPEPQRESPPEPRPENREAEPRHHILYVNVGQQLHAVYRLLPSRPIFHTIRNRNCRPNSRDIFPVPTTLHLDSSALVTDSAVRRFGRAVGEDISYVHIGPNGPYLVGGQDAGVRPSRSNLRVLSITGFRNITDRSLVHLATAAPFLRLVDFTETGVTPQGVENFKSLRPDCEVRYSEFVEKKDKKC